MLFGDLDGVADPECGEAGGEADGGEHALEGASEAQGGGAAGSWMSRGVFAILGLIV